MKHWVYIYSRNPEEGNNSIHLMSEAGSYFNNSKNDKPLPDGSILPEKLFFETEKFDHERKQFTGHFTNNPPIMEVVRVEVLMQFNDDWTKITEFNQMMTM